MNDHPPTETIRVDSLQLLETLNPRLRGGVFHVTPRNRLEGITSSQAVLHNRDERFEYATDGSDNSYGRLRGWVCLFDFREKSDSVLNNVRSDFQYEDPFKTPIHPMLQMSGDSLNDSAAYLFLQPAAYGQLISAATAVQEPRPRTLIRDVECWWPGNLPLTMIASILIVDIDRTNERRAHNIETARIDDFLRGRVPHRFCD